MRTYVPLEELTRLLPDIEELDGLHAAILGIAVPPPEKEWASSSAYATVDKRVVSRPAVQETLDAAERALQEQIAALFGSLRDSFDHYWSGDHGPAVLALISMGEAEEERGRLARARALYESALSLALPLPDKLPQVLALRRTARVLWHQGELSEGREYYARSAELARAAEDLRGEVIARIGIGNTLVFQGRWPEAEVSYRAAVSLIDESAEADLQLERGQLYNNLGSVNMRQGRLAIAEEWLNRARELWQRLDSSSDLAVCYHNLGLLRIEQGRVNEAQEVLLAALALPVSHGDRSVIATDLSDLFIRQGMLTQAAEWGREAEKEAIASGLAYHMSHMYRGLGNIARARKDHGGITFYEKSVEIARRSGQLIAEGEALVDYALHRANMGETDEALSYLDRAREIFTHIGARHELEHVARTVEEISPSRVPVAAAV